MADYLLDTTTFSFPMRDDANVRARISALAATDRIVVCSIVRGEILYGIERLLGRGAIRSAGLGSCLGA